MPDNSIPVTVLSGILGAGKTTALNHVLSESDDRDLAVLVNDMGEVNVDEIPKGSREGERGAKRPVSHAELEDELTGLEDRSPTFEPPEEALEADTETAEAEERHDHEQTEELGIAD